MREPIYFLIINKNDAEAHASAASACLAFEAQDLESDDFELFDDQGVKFEIEVFGNFDLRSKKTQHTDPEYVRNILIAWCNRNFPELLLSNESNLAQAIQAFVSVSPIIHHELKAFSLKSSVKMLQDICMKVFKSIGIRK